MLARIDGARFSRELLEHVAIARIEREIRLGKHYQLFATSTKRGQIAWLGARSRCHAHIEDDIKHAGETR